MTGGGERGGGDVDAGQRAVGASFSINDAVPIHLVVLTASQQAERVDKKQLYIGTNAGGTSSKEEPALPRAYTVPTAHQRKS